MRLAWSEAAREDPDYFLLFNDDTEVVSHAVSTLLNISGPPENRMIAVAAIADPSTNKIIYGAYRNGITGNLPEIDTKEHCDTFNANCVLLTSTVYHEVGMFDSAFTHGMADHDYGFIASRAGINITQSTETLGTCSPNCKKGTWQDSSLSRRHRWHLVSRPNGLLWRDWLYYCRRHLGWKWPIYFAGPYLKILLKK
jgi:GT2 family glycosyltransferase